MSESAYDISYLLEAELAKFSSSTPQASRPQTRSPAAAAAAAERSAAATQAAMANELLSLDSVHEELIRQYTQISSYKAQA
jgi:hypothetical protein